jgi:acyl-CoA synthetase (AMP-forming)/AMP-acid ligase II/alkylation response protein AidB-like acyl-CoA dehydrogenase/acyl carrier protein
MVALRSTGGCDAPHDQEVGLTFSFSNISTLADSNISTLGDLLRQRVLHQPQHVGWRFLPDGETDAATLTYAALDRQARTIAATLQLAGLAGERALLLYPPGLDYIAAFFGCLYAETIAVPAYPPRRHHSLDRVGAIARDAQSRVILTTIALKQEMQSIADQSGLPTATWITTNDLTGALADQWIESTIEPEHLAFLQYTSGSTGNPKGVKVSHGNLLHNLAQIHQYFGHSPQSRGVIWLPPYHDMGLIGGVLQPLYGGFPVTLMPPVTFLQKPLRWLQAISNDRATTSGAPNFAYALCVEKITSAQRSTLDLSTWEVAFTGAEPIRKETLEQFADTFADCGFRAEAFYPCYGLAEATLIVAGGKKLSRPNICEIDAAAIAQNQVKLTSAAEQLRSFVSCGIASAAQEIAIVDPNTLQRCDSQQVGEIWVTGKSVAQGYWNQPEATEATFKAQFVGSHDRWLRTGDLGFQQAGELYVTGRIKEVMIIRGRNYYPQDIERTVGVSHAAINPLCSAAFSLEIDGVEQLAIVQEVQRSDWRSLNVNEIISAMRRAVSQHHGLQVYAIQLLKPGSIPKTSSGKIQRYRCKEEFQDNTLNSLIHWSISKDENLKSNYLPDLAAQSFSSHPNVVINSVSNGADNSPKSSQANSLIRWLRDYANYHLNSRLMDERRCISPPVVLDFGNQGLLGMQVPQSYGGLGLDYGDMMQILQQLGAIDPTLALFVGLNNVLGIRPILHYGQSGLKDELLPRLARGRELAAFALTEAGAGSNPQAIATQAKLNSSGDWQLSGTKIWSGSAAWSSVIAVFAQQVDGDGRSLGIGAFAVRRGSAGLRQGTEAMTMGMRGMVQNTVHLDQVAVPGTHQLGGTGAGMTVAQDAMMLGRLAIAAACVGGMKRCAQLMQRYGSRRSVATGKLLEHPVLLTRLQELLWAIAVTEALVNKITTLLDQTQTIPVEAYAACKISAPEFYWQAADLLVQTLGGRGYIETNLAPQILRDARVLRIFEGPTETLCGWLGSRVLHQPAALDTWLHQDLAAPAIADRLHHAVQQIQSQRSSHPFGDALTANRWTAHIVGELATEAILWAAITSQSQPSSDSSDSGAIAWIQQRFEQKLAAALRPNPTATHATATAVSNRIARYVADIGDVEQTWAAPEEQLDGWLRREEQNSRGNQDSNESGRSPLSPLFEEGTEVKVPLVKGDLGGSTQPALQRWLMEWLSRTLNITIAEIEPDRAFADYGIDSVMAVELAQEIQDTWTLAQELDATVAWNFPTIAALATHLADLTNPTIASPKVQAADQPLDSSIAPPPMDSTSNPLDDLSTDDMAALLAQEIANARQRTKR